MDELQVGHHEKVLGEVFGPQKPRKKINKALKTLNKRVSKVGTTISRTTGIVDGEHSDSDSLNEREIYYVEGEETKGDSEFMIIHDSLVSFNNDGESTSPGLPPQQQFPKHSIPANHSSCIQDQFQKNAANIQQQWGNQQYFGYGRQYPQRTQYAAGGRPYPQAYYNPSQQCGQARVYTTPQAGRNSFMPNAVHQQYASKRQQSRSRYRDGSQPYEQRRFSYPQQQPPEYAQYPISDQYFVFGEDARRQEIRKRQREEEERNKRQQWQHLIDMQDDQSNDYFDMRDMPPPPPISPDRTHPLPPRPESDSSNVASKNRVTFDLGAKQSRSPERAPERAPSAEPVSSPPSKSIPSATSSPQTQSACPTLPVPGTGVGFTTSKKKISLFAQDEKPSKFSAKALFGKRRKPSVTTGPSASEPPTPEPLFVTQTASDNNNTPSPSLSRASLFPPSPSPSHFSVSSSSRMSNRSDGSKSSLKGSRTPSPYKTRKKRVSIDSPEDIPVMPSEKHSEEDQKQESATQDGFISEWYKSCVNSTSEWVGWATSLHGGKTVSTGAAASEEAATAASDSAAAAVANEVGHGGKTSPATLRSGSARPGSVKTGSPDKNIDRAETPVPRLSDDEDGYSFKGMGDDLMYMSPPPLDDDDDRLPTSMSYQSPVLRSRSPLEETKGQKRMRKAMEFLFQKRPPRNMPIDNDDHDERGRTSAVSTRAVSAMGAGGRTSVLGGGRTSTMGRSTAMSGRNTAMSGRHTAMNSRAKSGRSDHGEEELDHPPDGQLSGFQRAIDPITSLFVNGFRSCARFSFVLRPVDAVADTWPALQSVVVVVELILLMWILYQVSIIIETIATAIKTLCMPVIVVSRFLGMKY